MVQRRRHSRAAPERLLSDGPAVAAVVAGVTLVGWFLVFAKTGTSLDLSAPDYVQRAAELPSLLVTGDPLADYRNWSLLPLVLGRLVGASTTQSFALVQAIVLVAGSVGVLTWVAWRRPAVAGRAVLAVFATSAPAYALHFMGSYDQVLLVALLGVALADRRRAAVLFGAVIGLTHAEVGVISVAGLVALAAVGIGPPVRVRAWALAGVVVARVGLTIWLSAAGQPSDRLSFAREYGFDRTLDHFAATWPVIVLTMAAGGWLIIAGALVERRSRRVTLVVAAILAVNLAVATVTIDQSRVVMFLTLPLVVALGAFAPAGRARPAWARAVLVVAAVVGLAMPFVIAWIGDTWRFGQAFQIAW